MTPTRQGSGRPFPLYPDNDQILCRNTVSTFYSVVDETGAQSGHNNCRMRGVFPDCEPFGTTVSRPE